MLEILSEVHEVGSYICQVVDRFMEEMEKHLPESHREPASVRTEVGFGCSSCNYVFGSEENTRNHMASNHQGKVFMSRK